MTKAAKQIPALSEKDKERFFSKIKINPETGCHEWTASKSIKGYGNIGMSGVVVSSHRVAYLLATGIDPLELCVCHTCDNPPCCNPEHLWLGTNADNTLDRDKKGRGIVLKGDAHYSRLQPWRLARGDRHGAKLKPESISKGSRNGGAKLSDSDVIEIRSRYSARDISQDVLALEFGVSRMTIQRIVLRKGWKHI